MYFDGSFEPQMQLHQLGDMSSMAERVPVHRSVRHARCPCSVANETNTWREGGRISNA
jgi:hypothetical protein